MTTHSTKTAVQAAAVGLAIMGLAGAARAQDPVELRVVDRNTGHVLRTWSHDGRLYVAGQPGGRYSLRVINHTDGRVLVVMSVDGVNILTGETAGYDQRGYIFGAHEIYDVTGWRKSNTQVAAFTFAPLPQSYAARTGRPANVGVIGMAVFNERVAPPPEPEASEDRRYNEQSPDGLAGAPQPPPAPSARAAPTDQAAAAATARGYAGIAPPAPRDERLGTGHGAREWSVVNIVSFERATPYPQFVRQIAYDTYANLVASGVIPPPDYDEHRPRPFPTTPDGAGYVPDPPE
ncbi:MAG TPA: hypothetical protein VHW60_21650 [Caulobacteraceae bacterium]|nr:hypothetical protein [Caulobacteraceae bacterium]